MASRATVVSRTLPPLAAAAAARARHDRLRQGEAVGPQHHDVHAAQRGHVHRRGGDGERQRLRVIGPREDEARRRGERQVVEGLPVGEAWQGWLTADSMLITGTGLRGDHRAEERVGEVGGEVLPPANERMPSASA